MWVLSSPADDAHLGPENSKQIIPSHTATASRREAAFSFWRRSTQISQDVGAQVVEAFESCPKSVPGRPGCFTTYYCPAHVLTIGWDHTNLGGVPPKISPGDVWSKADCDQAFSNDMHRFESWVTRTFAGVPLTQYEFDALVDGPRRNQHHVDLDRGPGGRAGRPCVRAAVRSQGASRKRAKRQEARLPPSI